MTIVIAGGASEWQRAADIVSLNNPPAQLQVEMPDNQTNAMSFDVGGTEYYNIDSDNTLPRVRYGSLDEGVVHDFVIDGNSNIAFRVREQGTLSQFIRCDSTSGLRLSLGSSAFGVSIQVRTAANAFVVEDAAAQDLFNWNTSTGELFIQNDATNDPTTFLGTGKINFTGGGLFNYGTGVALGAAAGATLGTIGGSGPTNAAQVQWLEIEIAGTSHWIPVWT